MAVMAAMAVLLLLVLAPDPRRQEALVRQWWRVCMLGLWVWRRRKGCPQRRQAQSSMQLKGRALM